jgi:hypothetical protein
MTESDREEKIDAFNARAKRTGWPTHCDSTLSFNSPMLREVLSVWREKAGHRPWPSRTDMTPRVMKNFLPNLAIVDVVRQPERSRYRLRLTGTWIDRHLVPASSQFLDEFLPEPFLRRWQDAFELTLSVGCPIRNVTASIQYRNQDFLEGETFYGPLGNPGEPANAILAVVTAKVRVQ